jgi:Leucine-rich repeat (LRR) protein
MVSKNKLERLPNSIGQLINLECLDISDNPLTTLPESIIQLKELEFITIAEDDATNKLVGLSTEVTDFLRGLSHGCRGWSDPIKPIRSNSIQEYLLRQQLLNRNTIVGEDNEYKALKNIDREALREVIKWAELCDLPSHTISRDPDELANQTSLSIDSYTQLIPKAIGCLTQLRNLTLNDCMSSGSSACQADDSLPNTITDLVNLETLSLVCKGLAFLPANLHELKNLKTLEITFHDAIIIPKVLAEMSCDIKLHLHSNQDKLPDNLLDNLADITCLTELSIKDERLAILPDNIGQLKNLKALSITSCYLKEIPQTIGALSHLTHLTLNCEALERLPESIGQLSQLEEFTVSSHKIQQFSDSLANLENLRLIDVPNQLIARLPNAVIERYRNNELWIKNISFTKLYTPKISEYDLSAFGFFLVNDDWDASELIDLKQKTVPEFLFGLQTTEKTIKQFDVVDGIIICKPDEVQQIMKVFETAFCLESIGVNYVGIPYDDLRDTLSFKRPAKFIQSSAVSMSELDIALSQIVSQISKEISIKSFIFKFEGNRYPSFEEWDKITVPIEDKILDEKNLFFNAEITDELDQCWIGAIYVAS